VCGDQLGQGPGFEDVPGVYAGKTIYRRDEMQLKRAITPVLAVIVLLGGLSIVPVARAGEGKPASGTANAGAPQEAAATTSTKSDVQNQIEELKQLVEAQKSRIDKLESDLATAHQGSGSAPAAPPPENAAGTKATPSTSAGPVVASAAPIPTEIAIERVAQQQAVLSKKVDKLDSKIKAFGPFTFSGDLRLRDEPFFGGPSNQSQVRDRERFRMRFNVNAKLNNDIDGGFSEASGDVNDPTTTNQTITEFYTRKAFNLDKAFINYHPHQLKYLTLTGGKFAYPWYNTELTWDKDLNPEGLAQTLAFKLNSTPVLKKVAFVGFELPFAEIAGVSVNDKRITQSVTYGGQIQTTWQFAKWLKLSAYSGFYNFHNADPIALALAKANAKSPQTPDTGLLPLGTGNTVQNSIVTTTAANVVTVAGTSYTTGVTSISNAQFASKFGLLDSLARFDIATRSEKWPIAFIGDFVQNTEACANAGNILAAPVNTASIHYTQSTNFACNSHQRRGYWAESQVGRAEKKGDWQFDYARIFIEREAVVSNFNYSDIRQGSNVTEHRAMIQYQADRNIQLAFTALIGRPLNLGSSTPPENWLERLQFDVIYKF
jgi:hypothetical protein